MDEDRLKHSMAVARKMVEIAKEKNLTEEEIKNCFIIGYNHDIGYEFTKNGINHNKIGGEILKNIDFKYWKEIYYHGEPNVEYKSLYLDILNQADMQIDKYGNDVGYEKRLEDIKNRYGENSQVYDKCHKLKNDIKMNEMYRFDYVNEDEFHKLERSLKKYYMLAYKKLYFDFYPRLKEGNFLGEVIAEDKENRIKIYELKLPTDSMFAKVHGYITLEYIVYEEEKIVTLRTIKPEDILTAGHQSERCHGIIKRTF